MNTIALLLKNKEREPETFEKCRSYLIEQLIEQKYSLKQEVAIIRQKDTKPEEYQEYFNYVEECKSKINSQLQ